MNPIATTHATLLPPHRRHHGITPRRVPAGRRGPTTRGADAQHHRADASDPTPSTISLQKIAAPVGPGQGSERCHVADDLIFRDVREHPRRSVGRSRPQGTVFVSAVRSPNEHPVLIVDYEASGTVAVFESIL